LKTNTGPDDINEILEAYPAGWIEKRKRRERGQATILDSYN